MIGSNLIEEKGWNFCYFSSLGSPRKGQFRDSPHTISVTVLVVVVHKHTSLPPEHPLVTFLARADPNLASSSSLPLPIRASEMALDRWGFRCPSGPSRRIQLQSKQVEPISVISTALLNCDCVSPTRQETGAPLSTLYTHVQINVSKGCVNKNRRPRLYLENRVLCCSTHA